MGEQRGLAPLLTVDLAPVTVELNLRESGARFPCKWSSVLEIYRTRIRTNNVIERLNREIRRRTRVVGTFPDGNSALMLVCARLRHVAGTQWGCKKYMNMKHLEVIEQDLLVG